MPLSAESIIACVVDLEAKLRSGVDLTQSELDQLAELARDHPEFLSKPLRTRYMISRISSDS